MILWKLQKCPILGRGGPARAQGRAWARPASRCGHLGRPRAQPTPQAGARALAGSIFGVRKTPCLFGLTFEMFPAIATCDPQWPFTFLAGGARARPEPPGPRPASPPGPGPGPARPRPKRKNGPGRWKMKWINKFGRCRKVKYGNIKDKKCIYRCSVDKK